MKECVPTHWNHKVEDRVTYYNMPKDYRADCKKLDDTCGYQWPGFKLKT